VAASRRALKFADAPTKRVPYRIFVGAPASRREFKFVDAPTKRTPYSILVGAPVSWNTPLKKRMLTADKSALISLKKVAGRAGVGTKL
jgi:hypothetical protein